MSYGSTCGAVTGALMALGIRYGNYELDDLEQKKKLAGKVKEFLFRFKERHSSVECRELCGFDFSKEGEAERAAVSGVLMEKCPLLVLISLEILQ
mgnify:CR=1 FL=1